MTSIMHPLDLWKFPDCQNEGCFRLRSQYKLIYDKYTSDEQVEVSKSEKHRIRPTLDFGEFSPCENESCMRMLLHYKSTYQKYLTQIDETERIKSELDIYKSTTSLLEVKTQSLIQCLEREKELLEIERKHNNSAEQQSLLGQTCGILPFPCLRCTKLKEEIQMLRSRCSHNAEKMLSWEKIREQSVDDLKKKVESLTSKLIEFRRKSMIKEDLFWKDEVIADLRQQLGRKPPAPKPAEASAPAALIDQRYPSSIVNIDPYSFNEPGDDTRQYLLTSPYVRKLAAAHPSHVFMDEHRKSERQCQPGATSFAPAPARDEEYVRTSFHVEEVNKWMTKFLRTESEISDLMDENKQLALRNADLESELGKLKSQHDELKASVAQRALPSSTTLLPGDCKDGFESFFKLCNIGDCECLDESTMYDAFFGRLADAERVRYVEWMYACCHQGAKPRQRDLHENDPDARAGKKAFRACLFSIGGVFKRCFNGRRNVWINVQMTDGDDGCETKKPKFAHTQPPVAPCST